MPPSQRFKEILDEMWDLHVKKNAGYSGCSDDPWDNFRMAEIFGVSAFQGCLIRLSDKFKRVANLVKNPDNEQVGESIKDTLKDLANYAVIAISLYEELEIEERKGKENIDAGNTASSNTAEARDTTTARPIYSQATIIKNSHEDTETKILSEWGETVGRGG